jgi:hypothetical protein
MSSLFGVVADQVFLLQLHGLDPRVCFAVFGDEEPFLVFGCFELMTELLDLLVEVMEFGFEMLLLLFENLCVLLLSLTGCEAVICVRKLR